MVYLIHLFIFLVVLNVLLEVIVGFWEIIKIRQYFARFVICGGKLLVSLAPQRWRFSEIANKNTTKKSYI